MLMGRNGIGLLFMMAFIVFLDVGCSGVSTFPKTARAGDTITIASGFYGRMDRTNTTVTIRDSLQNTQDISGNIRSIFYLYPDPTSETKNYTMAALISPGFREDPKQATVVVDLPASLPQGLATVVVSSTSSGSLQSFSSSVDIIPGQGSPTDFAANTYGVQDITKLEPLHQAEISFSTSTTNIGAVELEIDFDQTVIPPAKINIMNHTFHSQGQDFQVYENMFYWDDNGDVLRVRIICPQGIPPSFLKFNIVYPPEIAVTNPFTIVANKTKIVDVDGNAIASISPILTHLYQ